MHEFVSFGQDQCVGRYHVCLVEIHHALLGEVSEQGVREGVSVCGVCMLGCEWVCEYVRVCADVCDKKSGGKCVSRYDFETAFEPSHHP